MNNITLAHIGGELVLIGGVAFYFQKRTTMLQNEITLLKKENVELVNAVEDLQDGLQQLGNMVVRLQRQLGQGSNTSPVEPQRHHHHHSATKNKRKQKPRQSEPRSVPQATPAPQAQQSAGIGGLMNMMMGGIPKVEKATPAPGPVTFPPPHQDSDDSGEETYDDKDLDEELETEYEQLNTERKENCEGDTCKLMD